MGRLIEWQPAGGDDVRLVVNVGDTIAAAAFGARVRVGAQAVEIVGPLVPGVIGGNEVLSPAGAPNTVLIIARRPGRSTVTLMTGDPWHAPGTATLELQIES